MMSSKRFVSTRTVVSTAAGGSAFFAGAEAGAAALAAGAAAGEAGGGVGAAGGGAAALTGSGGAAGALSFGVLAGSEDFSPSTVGPLPLP